MNNNSLLEEKWRTQKKLAKDANYEISKMLDNAEKILLEIEKKKGIKFKFAKVKLSNPRLTLTRPRLVRL